MKYLKKHYGIIIVIACLAIFGFQYFSSSESLNEIPIEVINETTESEKLQVEIKGEIQSPGIYGFEQGDRIVDIINKAGGLTLSADISSINRSEKVIDEMVIWIPKIQNHSEIPTDFYAYIQVEIKGEVWQPGIYKIPENSILIDLIEMAGGLTHMADTQDINLAKKLENQVSYTIKTQVQTNIYVEIKGEVQEPGVYEMEQDDLIKDLVDKAGGLTENASIDQTNLADQLSNHQVITIHHYLDLLDEKAAEVKGCVNQPGVYYFYQEIRIIDLIQMAGGFNNLADYSDINLSDVVKDTDVIIIPEIENEETIAVDLKGEVKYPGVYYLKEGSRVIDLLHLAGGLRPEADTTDINFSRLLVDEDVIEIKKIENTIDYIYVEIKGQVFLPGIYALEPGTRLVMLLNRAGGLTNSADDSLLNRTRILEDGEVIVIPSINEEHIWIRITGGVFDPGVYQVPLETSILDLIEVAGGLTIEADMDQIDFSVTFNENTSIHIPLIDETNPGLPNQSDGLININIASLEELQTLTGIGIILAERIIAYRESNGPFDSIENIMNVSGIGESIYENIKDDITV